VNLLVKLFPHFMALSRHPIKTVLGLGGSGDNQGRIILEVLDPGLEIGRGIIKPDLVEDSSLIGEESRA
jgi:hypothetical protein